MNDWLARLLFFCKIEFSFSNLTILTTLLMRLKSLIAFAFSCFFVFKVIAQKSPAKFGNVSEKDFANKIYPIDSNASAVVIADIGSSEIVGNSKSWFSLEFKYYRRVHILNKNGYDEANVEIPLYNDGDNEEKLDNVKAVTYNLVNGKVVETKLDKGGIFKDKLDKHRTIKKFTLPDIKEGSIIEYQYTVSSDFLFNLQPWTFQGQAPVLWSEYNLRIPEFFGYVFLTQGYRQYDIYDKKDARTDFRIQESRSAGATENLNFAANVSDYRWVMKNVPALKTEAFTSTLKNHIAKIEFQLSDYRYPLDPKPVMSSWSKFSEDLLKAEFFGNSLDKNNGWLGDVMNPLIAGSSNNLEKAKKIYAYVRDNLTCTSHSASDLDQPLRNVLKTRNGTVAEINLLLIAMLKYVHINADPVVLSTRSHGYTNPIYPIWSKFNYVICDATIDNKTYFLDASEPRLGFGKLTPDCYNGHARIINADATPIEFLSDSLLERKNTSLIAFINSKGEIEGSLQQQPGYYESHEIREKIKEKGKDEFFKDVKKVFTNDMQLISSQVDSLDNLEENIAISYSFKLNQDKEDIMYINPMFGEGYKENPFKSAERFYPVEMPYTIDETYSFNMVIPEGYMLDELPKSLIAKLNEEGDGRFEYRISESMGNISMRCRLQLKRAFYAPEEYEMLREFFNFIVTKETEQIVLKKKK